jgi:transcriptional regulator with XRE-family HTH domain
MGQRGARRAFASVVRKYRLASELSQEELAFRAGLHRNYVSGLERGNRNPSLETILAIADALGVNASVIVSQVEQQKR